MRAVPAMLLVLLALLLSCGAQTPEPQAPESVEADGAVAAVPAAGDAAPSFLWRVEGGSSPSYLLGTIHIGVSLDEGLPVAQAAALDGARVVIVETDPRAIDPQVIQGYARLPEDESLEQIVGPETWQQLLGVFGEAIPADALQRLRPWFLSTTLLMQRVAVVMDGRRPPTMDLEVMARATSNDVTLRTLESPDTQMELMTGLLHEVFVELMREVLRDPTETDAGLRTMMEAYRAGDDATLQRELFDAEFLERYPQYYSALFDDRNRSWLPVIDEEVERGGAFIAVGVGHMLGEQGLVALLRERGRQVERVRAH